MLSGALDLAMIGIEAWPNGVPAQIHYTSDDPFRDQVGVDTVAAQVSAAGASIEIFEYRGAGHLFIDPSLPIEYDAHAAELAARERVSFLEACRRAEEVQGLAARAVGAVLGFVRLVDELSAEVTAEGVGPTQAVEAVWDRTGYLAELEADEHDVEALGRTENVRELASVAEDFAALQPAAGVVEEFLERVALVFVAGMEDGLFPHSRAPGDPDELEEERRLAYVAMTRAEERLYLVRAWRGRSRVAPAPTHRRAS